MVASTPLTGGACAIVLATLPYDHRLAGMTGGNAVSASAIHRRTREITGLLAARAPRLDRGGTASRRNCPSRPARQPAQRQASQALSAARAPVEHGFSNLKNRRSFTRLRINPGKATALLRALPF